MLRRFLLYGKFRYIAIVVRDFCRFFCKICSFYKLYFVILCASKQQKPCGRCVRRALYLIKWGHSSLIAAVMGMLHSLLAGARTAAAAAAATNATAMMTMASGRLQSSPKYRVMSRV